jgi:hypothetical protein
MLLNEFLKEHRKNQQQKATMGALHSILAQHQSTNVEQKREIEARQGGVKRADGSTPQLSARVEASTSATKLANNH